ncbi:helix-turn-helix domain-containing protein [Phytoactinopolyspora endophytica]|uniref:helix-turn-helix domain-containing protein n=1 Tax=Phytoactinopolyspora endophytica TaxID=1642495 RepID=UPI00197B52C5|nr:helix-turn-helix transcriptional regulator [Phytoactinopolyspora endophytica]
MPRSYDDVMTDRWDRTSPKALECAEAFRQAHDIAAQVIALRLRHGLTQAELAERCGMDQGDISRIERGSTNPTARTLQRIAEALEADVRLVDRPAPSPQPTPGITGAV